MSGHYRYWRQITDIRAAALMDYNHYSLLKTVEKIFGLPLLGDAKQPQVRAFGSDVFTG
jgi:hypothetical protein